MSTPAQTTETPRYTPSAADRPTVLLLIQFAAILLFLWLFFWGVIEKGFDSGGGAHGAAAAHGAGGHGDDHAAADHGGEHPDDAPVVEEPGAGESPPSDLQREIVAATEDGEPRLSFTIEPGVTLEQEGVALTLERLALRPRTAARFAQEPVDLPEQPDVGVGYFLAITVGVSVDGTPLAELPPGESIETFGPFALEYAGHSYWFRGGFFEPIPGSDRLVYHMEPVQDPPKLTEMEMSLRFVITLEGREDEIPFVFEGLGVHGN